MPSYDFLFFWVKMVLCGYRPFSHVMPCRVLRDLQIADIYFRLQLYNSEAAWYLYELQGLPKFDLVLMLQRLKVARCPSYIVGACE